MADILTINTKEANEKLILINRYFMLIIVGLFGSAIAFLYFQQKALQQQLIEILQNDIKENIKIIQNNSTTIKENTLTLDRINQTLKK